MTARERDRWSLLVVDDQPSFALHIFRFLSRSLGIGNGAVRLDGEKAWGFDGKPWLAPDTRLASDDGIFELFWIPAASGWLERLRAVSKNPGKLLVIADVMGKRKSDYGVSPLLKELQQLPPGHEIRVVSAYHSVDQIEGYPVRPKSLATLREIRRVIYGDAAAVVTRVEKKPVKHILITGAGFEIHGNRGGFGVPQTAKLLEEMKIDEIPFVKKRESVSQRPRRSARSGPDPSIHGWKRNRCSTSIPTGTSFWKRPSIRF